MKQTYLWWAPLLVLVSFFVLEQIVDTNYIWKTIIKIILFVGTPLIYYFTYRGSQSFRKLIGWTKFTKKEVIVAIGRGSVYFFGILVAYYFFSLFVDVGTIITDLQLRYGITASVFLLVAFYITFVNSFIEEIFFRGFMFLQLHKKHPRLSYLYPSLLFGIYHVAIFYSWFSWWLMIIIVIVLTFASILWCHMNLRSQSVLPSYVAHIGADAAIVLIGLVLFGFV